MSGEVDDFGLHPLDVLDALDAADVYELIVERHRVAATVLTSTWEPIEWLGGLADPLLGEFGIDRLRFAAHDLVAEGESYRQGQKPGVTAGDEVLDRSTSTRRSSCRRR